MQLKNLTPHAITILRSDKSALVLPKPPEGTLIPRVSTGAPGENADLSDALGVRVVEQASSGPVVDLPEQVPDTFLIVSALVRIAAPHRRDLVSPGALVRGPDGQPTGCDGLVVTPEATVRIACGQAGVDVPERAQVAPSPVVLGQEFQDAMARAAQDGVETLGHCTAVAQAILGRAVTWGGLVSPWKDPDDAYSHAMARLSPRGRQALLHARAGDPGGVDIVVEELA